MTGMKKTVGVVEEVIVKGLNSQVKVQAKVDTGAQRTSVDSKIAAKVGLGPIVSSIRVKSSIAKGAYRRPLAQATIVIAGTKFEIPVSIVDRKGMTCPVLIGMDILKSGCFLIDPSKSQESD